MKKTKIKNKPQITIDRGIPPPKSINKYPFAEMQVGDSCFIPGAESRFSGSLMYATMKINARSNTNTTKFTTHRESGGVRVWRIK